MRYPTHSYRTYSICVPCDQCHMAKNGPCIYCDGTKVARISGIETYERFEEVKKHLTDRMVKILDAYASVWDGKDWIRSPA